MGAGRRTQTFTLNEKIPSAATVISSGPARNLRRSDLGGVIFGCKHSTIAECMSKQLFGLPAQHFSYVKNIEPGVPLFLFNYSDRKMHGIFESASNGLMNIDPYGWTENGTERTLYPAQVRICARMQCQPLNEGQFRPIIADNYYTTSHFWFELDHSQVGCLVNLFTSKSNGGVRYNLPKPLPNKWQSIGSTSRTLDSSARMDPSVCANQGSKPSACWVQANAYEALELDDADNNGYGSSSRDSSSVHDADYNLLELKPESLDQDPVNMNPGCSSTDGESETLEAHTEELKDGYESLLQNMEALVFYHESKNDVPCVPETTQEDDRQLVLVPSISSVKDETVLPISSDLHREIAELREGMQELKSSHTEQLRWNIALNEKLIESNIELQKLRSRVVELESKWDKSTDCIGEGSIFLIGGFDETSWLARLDSYSPANDKIKSLEPMSFPRSYACATALDGDIYVIGGGINGDEWFNTVECYSPGSNRWIPCPSLNKRKGSLAGASIQSKLYAIGGGNGGECFSDVEMFDPILGRWINSPSMFQQRFAPAAAEINGAIYAVGGYDGTEYLKSTERFDPREASWTRLPSMSSRRGCHSLAVLNEKLYSIGGFDGDAMINDVEVFDPRAGGWMRGVPLNKSRGYAATAVLGHSIYTIGGVEVDKILLDTVERYTEGVGWQETNLSAVGKRCFFSAIVL